MTFHKAVRYEKKLRMALTGPSGSGKTYTALEIATGIGGKIGLIDTERGSASLYGDKFDFDTLELEYFGVDNYVNAINAAAEAGYNVLVIDSLSHAWSGLGGVLDAVNNTRGNTFTDGWGKVGTPQQNRLMDTILSAPVHIVATIRVKMGYEVEKDELEPEQKMPIPTVAQSTGEKAATNGNKPTTAPRHWGDLMEMATIAGKTVAAKKLRDAGMDYLSAWKELFAS